MNYKSFFIFNYVLLTISPSVYCMWTEVEKNVESTMATLQQQQTDEIQKQVACFLDATNNKYNWFSLSDYLENEYFKTLSDQIINELLEQESELVEHIIKTTQWSQPAEDIVMYYTTWLKEHPNDFLTFETYLKIIFLCHHKQIIDTLRNKVS